jgi:geranylgeranyl pyrophosphate synthase
MEELLELKDLLLKGDVPGALLIVEELEEMSKQDIIDNIRSYAVILLLHLIKQQAENRTTRSWNVSIRNSVREIQRKNKCRKAGGYYLTAEELLETLQEAYLNAIDEASLEVEEGCYEPEELEQLVKQEKIINRAVALISSQE